MSTSSHTDKFIRVEVSESLRAVAAPALVRLGYLFPNVTFSAADGVIEARYCGALDETALRRDICYTIYRESIFRDTRDLRQALVEAVTRR